MPPSAGRKGRGSELPALWQTCPPPPRSLGPRAGGTGRRSELSPRQNRPSCPQPRCPRLPVTPGTDSLSLHTSGPSARPGPGLALSSLRPSLPAEVPARARLTCVSHRAPPLPRLCPPSRQRLLCSGTLTPTGPQRRLGACAHRPVGSPRCTLTLPPAPPLGTGSTRSAARGTPPAPQPARCAPCPSAHSLLPQGPLLSLGPPPAHTRAEGNPGSPPGQPPATPYLPTPRRSLARRSRPLPTPSSKCPSRWERSPPFHGRPSARAGASPVPRSQPLHPRPTRRPTSSSRAGRHSTVRLAPSGSLANHLSASPAAQPLPTPRRQPVPRLLRATSPRSRPERHRPALRHRLQADRAPVSEGT